MNLIVKMKSAGVLTLLTMAMKKEAQYARYNGVEEMLQTLMDRVTIMNEDVHHMHQSNEEFERDIKKVEEIGEETNLSNTMNMPTLQNEVDQEEISSHVVVITDLCDYMVSCILEDIPLNVIRLIFSNLKFYRNYGGMHLLFPYLITDLCKRARVVVYPGDTWVYPGTPIYSLKIQGEGAPGKNKKRKINIRKSIIEDSESSRPSTTNPFDDISNEIRTIKDLVSKLPYRQREPSNTCHS
ncbi:hypothetical protein FXO38_05511 [Capsicum annuum]|nr:hypothetical protein FXO38_05511 [Capsicum annuum]KAF3676449.1 hypothetical protein FXO37_05326 [Capsicum annuum]